MIETVARIGQLAACLALALSLYAVVQSLWSVANYAPARLHAARNAIFANFALISLGCGVLVWSFVAFDFSVAYVARNSNLQLPLIYRMTALWGAHEGSLMLWLWYLTLLSSVAIWMHWRDYPLSMPWIIATLAAIQFGFLAFIVFLSNPFVRITPAPPDGQDLNPLLQDPGLIVHPPVLYLGYVGFSVPFAFAIASLARGDTSAAWVRAVRRWTLFAWILLTTGILLGGFWAYYELGWGGYWAWDPVENASLMPWLTATALLHSMMAQDRRDLFRSWNVFLIVTTFLLTLMGTFLVRSGVLTSVHAFAVDPGRGAYMLCFLTAAMVVGYGLILFRADRLTADSLVESPWSRESAILANNVLLVIVAAIVFVGTLYPLLLEAIFGQRVSVGAPYFNKIIVPLMLGVVVLLGVGPSTPWRAVSRRKLMQSFSAPSVVAIVTLMAAVIVGLRDLLAMSAIAAVAFAGAAVLNDIARSILARRRTTGEPWWKATRQVILLGRQRMGGLVAHLGVVLVGAGMIGSGLFQSAATVSLRPGESFELAGYAITLRDVVDASTSNYQARAAVLSVARDGAPLFELRPEKRFYPARKMATTEIALRSSAIGDLYVLIGEETRENGVTVRAYWNPLVNWIWTGWLVIAAGALLSLSAGRRATMSARLHARPLQEAPAQ